MFGSALLINPVTAEGATQRALYLPAGSDWVDFWTGKHTKGGQTITAEAPLERIPIYARCGSIVPFGPRSAIGCQQGGSRSICGFTLEPTATSALYEDEGDNYDYEHGARSVIPIHWDRQVRDPDHRRPAREFPRNAGTQDFPYRERSRRAWSRDRIYPEADATVEYEGKAVSIRVPLPPTHEKM